MQNIVNLPLKPLLLNVFKFNIIFLYGEAFPIIFYGRPVIFSETNKSTGAISLRNAERAIDCTEYEEQFSFFHLWEPVQNLQGIQPDMSLFVIFNPYV